jgi:hypothetical protein
VPVRLDSRPGTSSPATACRTRSWRPTSGSATLGAGAGIRSDCSLPPASTGLPGCPTWHRLRVKPKDLASVGVRRVGRVAGIRDGLPVLEGDQVVRPANVVWCTGYHPGLSWIDLPVFGPGPPHPPGSSGRAGGTRACVLSLGQAPGGRGRRFRRRRTRRTRRIRRSYGRHRHRHRLQLRRSRGAARRTHHLPPGEPGALDPPHPSRSPASTSRSGSGSRTCRASNR